ncbi:MAG: sulfatase-like hydrolase/transferase, partial [Planctomycetota bacterium]|nr:sulfatase-like hydrolase/transferase [Planctomycetota bacterium]
MKSLPTALAFSLLVSCSVPADRDPTGDDEKTVESRPNNQERQAEPVAHPLSPPLLTEPRDLYFSEQFSEGQVSDRWGFNKDWSAENGVLQRSDHGNETTRIFLKDAHYRDVIIRFDFQFQKAKDIRLVTGGGGHYNAVIHIRHDHFYVQTAADKSVPYFSFRHGECAYEFDPKIWYTMTIEFLGDHLVAHIDRDHLAFAHHPILDKERSYFAFQVDDQPAAFDNVQIIKAHKHEQRAKNLAHIQAVSGKHPVKKSSAEAFDIQKRNAHEWLYQRHPRYRALVDRVSELDTRKKELFPDAFRSTKESKKKIGALRKKYNQEDPRYKELLHATHRAKRAIDGFLFAQEPGSSDLPDSRRKRELERLRRQHRDAPEHRKLIAASKVAQQELERAYPQLFTSDEQIARNRNRQRDAIKNDPRYKKLTAERAATYREQQQYLFDHDPKLTELRTLVESDLDASTSRRTDKKSKGRPNFIVIFIDDMGYGDIGPFGSRQNETPNLDRMAEEGMKLTSFYVASPVCSPSRAALMTGCYPKRVGLAKGSGHGVLFPGDIHGLHPDEITIAEMLKNAGYTTGCFGKWHLGDQPGFLPTDQGFDEYFGIPYSNDMWPGLKRWKFPHLPVLRGTKVVDQIDDMDDQATLCRRFTEEAVKFIEKHSGEPFFVYLPHAFVHGPRKASPTFMAKAKTVEEAQVEEIDWSVGQIFEAIREAGIEKNTFVLFTSDNGAAGGLSSGPLRGGKGSAWEGGVREPTLAWWPGKVPAGSVCAEI